MCAQSHGLGLKKGDSQHRVGLSKLDEDGVVEGVFERGGGVQGQPADGTGVRQPQTVPAGGRKGGHCGRREFAGAKVVAMWRARIQGGKRERERKRERA
eukprot:3072418-Rhodomonas_salina.1